MFSFSGNEDISVYASSADIFCRLVGSLFVQSAYRVSICSNVVHSDIFIGVVFSRLCVNVGSSYAALSRLEKLVISSMACAIEQWLFRPPV